MNEVSIVGVDLAKQVFQVHGAAADGRVLFRKKLSRPQFAKFMTALPRCVVAMEACGTAHYWGRELARHGHDVRLIPPIYVKPFVKRQKNDAADAEAVAEAALRPTMRSVAVKTAGQQAQAMLFRTRDLLVGQRTQLVNALRGHLAEHGIILGKGIGNIDRLAARFEEDEDIPDLVRNLGRLYLDRIAGLSAEIGELDGRIAAAAKESDVARKLQTMPGIGPVCAMAIGTFAPDMREFRRARDFSAWLGLVPRQHSSGGKQKLGRTSKMGQRDIRRLLIVGAMSVVHWRGREGGKPGSWLSRMLARKPRMLVAIALANKMARMIWAMLSRDEDYRDPTGAVC
ncbi:Transposase [Paracoccus solventivorans]|jgi:transposase|uniref:Transposase n=1 Tax=Paracoccus solventivorans TaxID=53463 RepID=A0A1M7K5V7_9RHOB|nr:MULTISPECIES: IS110 family transposase [Paracoccaceae]SHM60636.1 Transposase [Paracoccus solventivorans]|tara:strand:- start:3248 stop:4273 length:1026 start_codon:yes stop_codon:yes gene_type:complete